MSRPPIPIRFAEIVIECRASDHRIDAGFSRPILRFGVCQDPVNVRRRTIFIPIEIPPEMGPIGFSTPAIAVGARTTGYIVDIATAIFAGKVFIIIIAISIVLIVPRLYHVKIGESFTRSAGLPFQTVIAVGIIRTAIRTRILHKITIVYPSISIIHFIHQRMTRFMGRR